MAIIAGTVLGVALFGHRYALGGALFGAALAYFIVRAVRLSSRVEELEERMRLYERTDRSILPRKAAVIADQKAPPPRQPSAADEAAPGRPLPERTDAAGSLGRHWKDPEPPPAAAVPPPARAAAAGEREPAAPRFDLLSLIKDYFTGGNVVVRVGVIVLFFGVAFLLKYTVDQGFLPIEIRLMGAAVAAVVLLAIGWRLRISRRVYGLTLQGGGVGILYLTIFAALKLYGLIPAVAAFGLLVFLSVFSAALAILQDARFLAVFGITGGFLAPILTSTGEGNHVVLFSYYLILTAGVVFTAWHRSWRELNLLGFFFTFAIGGYWGYDRYQPELFASTEPFLILFFLAYVAVAVFFAHNQPPQLKGYVDSTIIFGTPILAFGYQAVLVQPYEYGLAWTALAAGLFYMVLATLLFRLGSSHMKTLVEVFLAMGVVFATLAVPLAVDGRWTSAVWALEGAGILWIALRQERLLARYFSIAIQVLGGLAFMSDIASPAADTPVLNSICLGGLLVSAAGLFSAWLLVRRRESIATARIESGLMLGWGVLWWFGTGIREIERFVDTPYLGASIVSFIALSVAAGFFAGRRLVWHELERVYLLLLPAMFLGTGLMFLAGNRPTADGGWLSWPLAVAVHLLLLYRDERKALLPCHRYLHIGLSLLTLFLVTREAVWWTDYRFGSSTAWVIAAAAIVPALFIELIRRFRDTSRWPLSSHRRTYLVDISPPPLIFLLGGTIVVNIMSQGDPSPLPYLPFLNPLDVTQVMVFLVAASWTHLVFWKEQLFSYAERTAATFAFGGALLFFWLNAVLIRTLHYWGGVDFTFRAMSSSDLVQTSLSIFWALTALVVMVGGTRRRSRPLWMTGAGLLAVVIVKLFTIDLSKVSTVERIVSFLVVGGLCLLIGYLAPLPQKGEPPAVEAGQ